MTYPSEGENSTLDDQPIGSNDWSEHLVLVSMESCFGNEEESDCAHEVSNPIELETT